MLEEHDTSLVIANQTLEKCGTTRTFYKCIIQTPHDKGQVNKIDAFFVTDTAGSINQDSLFE